MIGIDNILDLGFTGIVILSTREKEDRGGYNDEHTWFEFVAKQDDQAYRMVIQWTEKTMGHKIICLEESREAIGEAEYVELVSKLGIRDTPAYMARLKAEREARAKVEAEREAACPSCPSCGQKMVVRRRRSDQVPFWGCPRFPGCDGTQNIGYAEVSNLSKLGLI